MTDETDHEQQRHAAPVSDDALNRLVDEHAGSVYRVARSVVRDNALAEDVVQETFIKAWQHADTFAGEVPIRNWLLRIAHNVAVSTLRTIRDQATDPGTLPQTSRTEPGPDTVVETRMTITDALEQLDPLSRSIVVLREVEMFSYDEISDILDLPLPTVKTRLFRARGQFKKMAEDLS